jgi:tRNA pseudouridine55 synthase
MSRRKTPRWNGLLPISKQSGPTSHDVVDMARKALGERRVGHTGTLDPMARGLLLLCVGRATRLQRYLLHWPKSYHGLIRLGRATTTYDGEGDPIDPQGSPPELDEATVGRLAATFSGTIEQLPPPFSAKKVSGKKLYELARDGKSVPVEPKSVTVSHLELDVQAPDLLSVTLTCSTGFYVRTLAHDIGLELGCGAHLHHLERVSIGPYCAADALAQEDLTACDRPEDIIESSCWSRLSDIKLPFSEINLNPEAAHRFQHGQAVVVFRATPDGATVGDCVAVRSQTGDLLGVGTIHNLLARGRTLTVHPSMVLGPSP